MHSRLLYLLLFVIFVSKSYGQNEPCKSYPMAGYTGNCDLTLALSPDNKYLYTSDKKTLKKWEIATNKVVQEIKNFPYELAGASSDPRFVYTAIMPSRQFYIEPDMYDLKLKKKHEPEITLLRLLGENKKSYEKFRKDNLTPRMMFTNDSSIAALVDGNDVVYKVQIASGKIIPVADFRFDPQFIPELNTFVGWNEEKDGVLFSNLITGKQVVSTTIQSGAGAVKLTPDKKYVVLSRDGSSFLDPKTFKEVFYCKDCDHLRFNDEGTKFYGFSVSEGDKINEHYVRETVVHSYPDFKELERVSRRYGNYKTVDDIRFDPNKELIYNWNGGADFRTGEVKVPFSYNYVMSQSEEQAAKEEKNRNIQIGNEAIAKLYDLKIPPVVHSIADNVKTFFTGWSTDGRVIGYSQSGSGGMAVVWSFPEGTPSVAYRDQIATDRGIASSGILIEGEMQWARMSPGGKTVALITNEGVLFYEGETLKAKVPGRDVLALLDNVALLSEKRKSNEVYYYKDIVLVDTQTGKVISKVKTDPIHVFSFSADVRTLPGKILVSNEKDIRILDPANPSIFQVIPNAQVPPDSPARYSLTNISVVDRLTGEGELISGFRSETLPSDKYIMQPPYVIRYYWNDGFYIYDGKAREMLRDKVLYPGWMNFDQVFYLSGINKLLVTNTVPTYTWPNAKDDDPGASAFTIDVATGEITPYLLTEPRSKLVEYGKTAAAAAFRYASLPCEQKTRMFSAGDNIGSANQPASIVLGYDCDANVYVVARRSLLYPGSNSIIQVSRLFAVTEQELSSQGYIRVKKSYEVCPKCHGHPVEFSKQTTSGWSDWEQKSLNIYLYTRKWETKTEEIGTRCSVCKGEAWIKVD